MHFITLVAVEVGDYPICKIADARINAEIAALSKIKADSIPDKVLVKCRLTELRSLTNSFARAVDSAVEYKLEPYCECTENEEYLEFMDETENLKQQYESGEDCIKLPSGKIVQAYSMHNKFCIKDGLVYEKNFGQLKQDKRSKRAKKMIALPQYPFKKLYKTFEEFAEKYCGYNYDEEKEAYGYYCNPNSFWDWYRIGGRWPCLFLVKADCEEYAPGNYDEDYKMPTPPEGYKWASAARKKDIQWAALIEFKKKRMAERFEFLRSAFEKKELPKDEWYLKLKEDGIYDYENYAVYLNGESFEDNLIRRKYLVDSDYLSLPCYYVDDEYWHTQSGWWGSSDDDGEWKEKLKKFYDSLSDDAVLVSVDCHD
ncbi:MAG: hypothetical protein HFE32_00560 [Clostridia bacterium]|jgi:hypothetical protein|nr:hypothetical protein [Clostridia bacterium]